MSSDTNRLNNYGTILSDLTKPFEYRTQLFQFDVDKHPYASDIIPYDNECIQNSKNLIQTNQFNITLPNAHLTDIDSELKGLGRYLSRLPEDRQFHPVQNFDANTRECTQKIKYNHIIYPQ